MNSISELSKLPKGQDVEIKGVVSYENPPRASAYGGGFSQFVVVNDGEFGIGVNIPVKGLDEGYTKGVNLVVKGKVDKYPDKKQPLTESGTYPIRTSIKASTVEEFKEVEDFPIEKETVVTEKDIKEADKPKSYSVAKNVEKEAERIMWEKKELKICKQAMIKAIGRWVEVGVIPKQELFKWTTHCVDFVYNEDDGFVLITEAKLMQSKLVEVSKAEAITWVKTHMKGTDLDIEILGVKDLDKQTLPELLETAVRVATTLNS